MCTSTDRDCDGLLFRDRESWFDHELQHRAPFCCLLCNRGPMPRPALREHLSTSHRDFNDFQLRMIEEGGQQLAHQLQGDCPFCSAWEPRVRAQATVPVGFVSKVMVDAQAFKDHVATHQDELAVVALPASPFNNTEERLWQGLRSPSAAPAIDWSEFDKIFPPSSWTAKIYNRGDDPFDPLSWLEVCWSEQGVSLLSDWGEDDNETRPSPSFLSRPEFRDAGRQPSKSKDKEPARRFDDGTWSSKSSAIPPPGQGSGRAKAVSMWIYVSPGCWAGIPRLQANRHS